MDSEQPNPIGHSVSTLNSEEAALAQRLVQLVIQRLEMMPLVAHTKYLNDLTIDDTKRENELFEQLTCNARWHGVPDRCAEQLMHAQLEASKQIQFHLFFEWLSGIRGFPAETAQPLADLRAQIDVLNAALIEELAAVYRRGVSPDWHDFVMQAANAYEPSDCSIPVDAIRTAIAPLARLY